MAEKSPMNDRSIEKLTVSNAKVKIRSCPQFEADFPPFYAQNEQNLNELNLAMVVQ